MAYVQGFVAAVPKANRQKYLDHATVAATVFREYGALRVMECRGEDVPPGEVTSFERAVKRQKDEDIVFAWIEWPSKAVCEAAFEKIMTDARMSKENNPMPFDGKRMIFGGFTPILDA